MHASQVDCPSVPAKLPMRQALQVDDVVASEAVEEVPVPHGLQALLPVTAA